jgi:uncharacterized membrane protein YagU involved in acid resistance
MHGQPRRDDPGMTHHRGSAVGNLLRGAVAGTAGTWLMDQVTSGMLAGQPAEVTEREKAVRPHGQHAVTNLVDRLEHDLGTRLTEEQKATATQLIHFGLGLVPGALYGLLRHRVPLLGAGGGVAYGLLLWALNDEYLNLRLGLVAPPRDYPMETHWRGLVGHVVLGVATDRGIDLLGG